MFFTFFKFVQMVLNRVVSHKNIRFISSRPEVFCKEGVLKKLVKFTGKHLCRSLFFNKVFQ